ncbi:PREDICTED: ribonuclease Oy [Dinoponera quadriceps]|uniref:Ribonuclease Oy n=1 Tax=Dinoponera quadriceps TaxID=609295 RepID=A0A6P3X966_DINQU|nr:PREDICTED: ribonuclease Oy [Dinoponera quadriceps]
MCKYNVVLCTLLLCLPYVTHNCFVEEEPTKPNIFDIVLFTQRWPLTACYMWKESSKSHSCLLPKQNKWTIHGIWPTQFHHTGPQFCNTSLSFDKNILAPIENELKEKWTDIQKGSKPYSFWKHEWDKHGTCAVTIEKLNSVFKYFQTGLKLLDTYNMIDVLKKANIEPGEKYMINDLLRAVQKILKKRAQVICTKNKKTGELYVNEIRICFDKTLQLVDCDGVYNFPTNCDKSELIMYPSSVPRNYQINKLVIDILLMRRIIITLVNVL